MRRLPLFCAVALLTATAAVAQEYRGTIEGRVVDESRSALPGVTVSAKHTATGLGAVAVTNSQGAYELPLLPPGIYAMTFELQGFRRVERGKVEVRVADRVVIDVEMKVGQLTETITVTASTPVLETGTASTGQVIDSKRLELMPLSDGNPFTLVRLAGGVVPFGDLRYFRPFDNNATAEFTASGAPTSNAYTIDGAPNNAHRQGNADTRMAFTPPAGAVEEFKVETSTFDAGHGRAAGATINVAMKAGSNTYRGDGYYHFRNEGMAENDYFLELRNQPEPTLDYNRRGFTLGGPATLPKMYSGRNRTFFFTAFEWLDDVFPDASQRTVPTVKMREGDFSELLPLGIRIYDPLTAFTNAAGRIERLPFDNNIIPPERISPVAREIMKYFPMPNQPADLQGRNNYITIGDDAATRSDDYSTMNFRVDHNLSPAHKVSGRYSWNKRREARGHWAGEVNAVRPVGFYGYRVNDSFGLDYIWTRSSSSFINVKGSWGRFQEFDTRQNQDVFDPASLGFSAQTVSLFRGYKYLPQMDVDSVDDIGATWLGGITSQGWAFQPTWTKLAGRHSFRTGYDLRINREDENFDGHAAGLYQFRGNFVRQFDNSSNQTGMDLATLLLGVPTGGRIENFDNRHNQVIYHGVFVQDDWRVSNKLTLNLGLRYEFEGAPSERLNRNVRGFDPNAILNLTQQAEANYAANPIPELPVSEFHARGGVRYTDDGNRGFWSADTNNLQPRVGVVYAITDKMIVRSGWAIYTQPAYVHGSRQLGFTSQGNLVPTLDGGLTFRASLFNPFPDGIPEPVGAELGPNTNVGGTLARFYDDIDYKNGQAMRFVIGIQRELPWRFMVEANYIGTRAYDLRTDVQVNYLPNEWLSTSPERDQARIDYLNSTSGANSVPNPLRGLVPGTNLNGQTTSRQRLLRPFPAFESIEGRRYDGSSRYDALQLRVDRRFSQGVSVLATYTYSRDLEKVTRLNEGDSDYEERPARGDVPHRFTINPIVELPFGRGRRFGTNANGWLDRLIGGWAIAGVYQYSSGEPLTIGNVYYNGDIQSLKTRITQGIDVNEPVFDISGFYFHDAAVQVNGVVSRALQLADPRKNLDRNLRTLPSRTRNFRGTPQNFLDFAIVKNLAVVGRARAQFKLEVYNATNYVWFRNPNLTVTNIDFGKVTSQGNLPREIQLSARISF